MDLKKSVLGIVVLTGVAMAGDAVDINQSVTAQAAIEGTYKKPFDIPVTGAVEIKVDAIITDTINYTNNTLIGSVEYVNDDFLKLCISQKITVDNEGVTTKTKKAKAYFVGKTVDHVFK